MRGCQVPSGLVIIRSLHFSFIFSELCLLPHGLLPLPSLGVSHTSTPTPWSVEYSHGAFSQCNSQNSRSSAGLEDFHPSETLPLGLGPVLPSTPRHGSPSPIARITSSELSQVSRAGSPPSTTWSDEDFHSRTWSQFPSAFPDLSGSGLCFSSFPPHRSDWPIAGDLQRTPNGAGATTLREFRSELGLSLFNSHSGLWSFPPSSEVKLIYLMLLHQEASRLPFWSPPRCALMHSHDGSPRTPTWECPSGPPSSDV